MENEKRAEMQHPVYSKIPLRIAYRFHHPKGYDSPASRIKPTRLLSRTYVQKLQTSVDAGSQFLHLTLWTRFGKTRLRRAFATV